jgi:hypothetical protein
MKVDFKFSPLQIVRITAHNLDYEGRVQECEYNGHTKSYGVEFAANGEILTRKFYEDELQ